LDYKLWVGFTEYILEKAGMATKDYANAASLRRQLKACKKNKVPLSSYWKLLAKVLFNKYKIKDDRIDFGTPLKSIEYEFDGEEYTTEIGYVVTNFNRFPAESILCLNSTLEEEEAFAIRTMKGFLKRYDSVDTSKIFSFQNYLCVLLKQNKEQV